MPKFPAPYDQIEQPPVHQDPTEGGSYLRNADGSLTLLSQTVQVSGRAERAALVKQQQPAPASTDTYQE